MISNTVLKGAIAFAPNVVGTGDCPSALHLDLAHHLPGRLRLRSALLKGNARASEETQRHLAAIRGVTSFHRDPDRHRPGIAIYVYFGNFSKGLGERPSILDWALFCLGLLATIALAILVKQRRARSFSQIIRDAGLAQVLNTAWIQHAQSGTS
jgi:hypothetical protein